MADDFKTLIIEGLKDISSKQEETNKNVSELTTQFKLHKQESQMRWNAIEKLDAEQNALLAEHSARSTAIQKDVELRDQAMRQDLGSLDTRVQVLEEPTKFSKVLKERIKKVAMFITSVGGAIIIILKLLEMI